MFGLNSMVKIVKIGTCTLDPGNTASPLYMQLKYQMGIGGGSTVTFIQDGSEGVLVDTGFDFELDASRTNETANLNRLLALLSLSGVRMEQISKVFITHFHRDHFGLIQHFRQAEWICSAPEREENLRGSMKDDFRPVNDGEKITPHTTVVYTPGHTRGHASLLLSAADDKVKIALSGDAVINLAWLESGYIWRFNSNFDSEENARKSIEKLISAADIIIPGHGQPFFTASVK